MTTLEMSNTPAISAGRSPAVPDSVLGWYVLETNDMTALAEHVNNWGDLIDIELNPVVEDAPAAEAAARVFGK